ncbi:cupin [Clostridium sp.]
MASIILERVIILDLIKFVYEEDGLKRGYENKEWIVGIKNYKKSNDIEFISNLERHNKTDEVFVLVDGKCSIVTAEEKDFKMLFKIEIMNKSTIYTIPKGIWHNTVTSRDAKLILIENSDTSMKNSDTLELDLEQLIRFRNCINI